jgi:hypothetical protein
MHDADIGACCRGHTVVGSKIVHPAKPSGSPLLNQSDSQMPRAHAHRQRNERDCSA